MAKRGSRRSASRSNGAGLFSRVWALPGGLVTATSKSARGLGSAAGNVVGRTVKAVGNVGDAYATEANKAVRKIISRRNRRNRRSTRRSNRSRRGNRRH